MAQPTTGSGRTLSQPLFVPTLMPMPLSQQAVITSGNVGVSVLPGSMTSVITSGSGMVAGCSSGVLMGGESHTMTIVSAKSGQDQAQLAADLYLCSTSSNATEALLGDGDGDANKPSIRTLEDSYKELTSRNIKDTLSSFLLDVPGEFDGMEAQDTTLRHLLEQRLVTRKDFYPMSGHALLGFRLLPGSLPEQARLDPPLAGDTRTQHRKRKHKHRNLEKGGEEGNDYNIVSSKVKMPNDAFNFVKDSQPPSGIPTPVVSHSFPPAQERTMSPSLPNLKVISSGRYPQPMPGSASLVGVSTTITHDPMNPFPGGKKKKKEKRNKEKKKEKKEKKKKKDKHHSQDPPSGQLPPPSSSSLTAHAPNTYSIP